MRLKSLAVTLWKEWRDHRVMVIAIALVLPGLTGIAFWSFGSRLIGATVRSQLLIFLPVALGLVFFSVAADLVAGEKRRNTLDLLRRLPGGLSRTFFVKWVFLFLVSVGALLWQVVCLATAWQLMAKMGADGGYGGARVADELYAELTVFPRSTFWQLALVGLVLPPWAFVVSTWLGRSGAAAIASLLVLGGLLSPWALLMIENPWFFPFGPTHLPWIAGALIALAVVVSAVSYLRGLRFHGAVWKPGLYGLAAVLVLTGAGYAYARVELQRWINFDQHDPGFRIKEAYIAEGGTRLYLNVHKGRPWIGGQPLHDPTSTSTSYFGHQGSPVQTWIVDLEKDEVTRDSTDGRHTFQNVMTGSGFRWSYGTRMLAPYRIVQCWHSEDEKAVVRWFDAPSGEIIDTLPVWTTTPAVDLAIREDARRYGYHIDSQGRRVWVRDNQVEREGEERSLGDRVRHSEKRFPWVMRNPIGWTQYRAVKQASGRHETRWFLIDAESGEERDVSRRDDQGRPRSIGEILDRQTSLVRSGKDYRILDLDTLIERDEIAENAPDLSLGVVAKRRVLGTYRAADGDLELRLWDPVNGTTWPVELDVGVETNDSSFTIRGRGTDGRVVITALIARGATNHYWVAVLDPETAKAKVVAHDTGWPWTDITPLVLNDDGSIVGVHEGRRVVKLGPALNQQEVIFPR